MPPEIRNHSYKMCIGDMKVGDTFLDSDRIYQKTDVCNDAGNIGCVWLARGEIHYFYGGSPVTVIEIVIILKE